MTSIPESTFPISLNPERKWGWLVFLGAIMVVCGVLALSFVGFTSIFSVMYLGALFIFTGVAEVAFAIRTRHDGHLWFHLLFGVLYAVAGWFIFTNPLANVVALTVLIAALLLVNGIVTLIGSAVDRFHNWGWFALNGVVSTLAGFLILRDPVYSSAWVIGVLVGVELVLRGFAWLSLGLLGRELAHRHHPHAGAHA